MDAFFSTSDTSTGDKNFKAGDTVKTYRTESNMRYPALVLSFNCLEAYRLRALRGLLDSDYLLPEPTSFTVYANFEGSLTLLGTLPSSRLKLVLTSKVFDSYEKEVQLDNATVFSGEMLFAFCQATA